MASLDAVPMNSLLIGAFTAVLLALLLLSRKKKSPKLNLPPSPPRLPVIGNLQQIGSDEPHKAVQSLSRKYGDLMLLHFGCDPTLIVSSADSAKEIFKTHIGAHCNNRPESIMAKRLLYDGKDIGFAPYGESWRNARRICADQILSTKRVQFYHPVRREELSLLAERIRASCAAEGSAINMGEMLMNLTMSNSSRMALGRKYEEEGNRLEDMLGELMSLFMCFPCRDFIPWLGWIDSLIGLDARAKRNAAQIDRFLETVLDEHIRAKRYESTDQKEYMDFVDVLLSLKDETLERIDIKALILDMFFAGKDTVYSSMESMMTELINNPRVMKILQEEIRGAAGSKEMVTDEDCDKMDYLDAVMKETLRMHPSVPLMIHRQVAQDVQVGGYDVPKKTRVIVNIYAIGRDPRTWERPDEFWPERFRCSDMDFLGQHCQFIPFGIGRRICPGSGLAITTAKFTIANLLLHFDWQTPDGTKVKIREPFGRLTDSGLILVAKPRSP